MVDFLNVVLDKLSYSFQYERTVPKTNSELNTFSPQQIMSDALTSKVSVICQKPDINSSDFFEYYVNCLFQDPPSLTVEEKSWFGKIIQSPEERKKFAKLITINRSTCKQLCEELILCLQQHFAVALFECHLSDDFSTAKTLMNMSFTYYYVDHKGFWVYPYMFLKDQLIFHDPRFWSAAFFDALGILRSSKPVIDAEQELKSDYLQNDPTYLGNVTFGQLGNFLFNIHAFELPFEFAATFLDKQCTIANMQPDQRQILWDYLRRLYDCASH